MTMASETRHGRNKRKRLALRGSNRESNNQRGVENDCFGEGQDRTKECLPSISGTVEASVCSSVYSSPGLSLTSPGSLHNLTVTYHYINSPISSSTRSLSELSSALPSDGATLRDRYLERTPSPPHSSPPSPSPTAFRPMRKKLKIGEDSQSATFQRLISIASQIQQCKQDSNVPSSSPPPKVLHPECKEHVLVDAQHNLTPTDGIRSDSHGTQDHVNVSCDDDEAFWSQAVDAMDERAWEGGGETEMDGRGKMEQRNEGGEEGDDGGDSAFIDGLLSSGLIVTPQESTADTTSHRANHSTPYTSQDHSTLPHHPTTPLSHRHAVSGKANPHHLF